MGGEGGGGGRRGEREGWEWVFKRSVEGMLGFLIKEWVR